MQLCDGSSKTLRVKASHEGIFLQPALALLHDGMSQKFEMRPGDLFEARPHVPQLINHGISADVDDQDVAAVFVRLNACGSKPSDAESDAEQVQRQMVTCL